MFFSGFRSKLLSVLMLVSVLCTILPSTINVSATTDNEEKVKASELILNNTLREVYRSEQAKVVTRAEVSRFMVNTFNLKNDTTIPDHIFNDVSVDNPYYRDICTVYKSGLIKGYADNTYHPDGSLTRAEYATILVHALNYDLTANSITADDIAGHWAVSYIKTVLDAGLMSLNSNNCFEPNANLMLDVKGQLIPVILPGNATSKKVKWVSENPDVAVVDQTGHVTGISEGFAVIKVSTEDGNLVKTCTIQVEGNRQIITGRVLKPDGTLLSGDQAEQISVSLSTYSSNMKMSGSLNSDGRYSISADIPDGDYILTADAACLTGQYANSKPQDIHITNGTTIIRDLYLTVPTITGRVLKPDGTVFMPENPDGYYMRETVELIHIDMDRYTEHRQVGLDGSFCIGADIPSGPYVLRVNTESVAINGTYTDSIERLVHVTQGQSMEQDLKLTNPAVRGRLLKPDGTYYESGRHLSLDMRLEAVNDPNFQSVHTLPNIDGSFRLGGFVPTGDYNIIANYDNNSEIPYVLPGPVKIHVTNGETLENNITLAYAVEVVKTGITNNQSDVEINPKTYFTFNKNVKIGPNYDKISISGDGVINSKEILFFSAINSSAMFELSATLKHNTNYTITIPEGAFIDDNNKYNKPFSLSFSTKKAEGNNPEEKKPGVVISNPVIIPGAGLPAVQVPDKVLIKVIKTTPGENETGVENIVKSVVVFDESKIKQGDNFDKISVSNGGKLVSKEISTDGTSLVLNISSKFAKKVSVTIPEGAVKSEVGHPNSAYSYNFTVKESDESLKVVSTTPQNGQSIEGPELNVKIVFSRKGLSEGDNFKDITINGGAVIENKQFDKYGTSLILKLSGIEKNKKYDISIPKGAVNDGSGIQNEAYVFGFNTNAVRKFSDIPGDHWAFSAITEMARNGIISGFSDNTFRPNNLITREQFAKIMVLGLKLDFKNPSVGTFADVQKNQWSYNYIETAKDYLTGFKKDGKYNFKGTEYTVREDIAVALVKALKLDNMQVDIEELKSIFKDEKNISPALKKYVLIAYKNKLISGYEDRTFRPAGKVTRAEAATLLYRVMKDWVPEEKVATGDIES